MKISIITACFNSEDTIACAIESVASQTYSHIEHIIIDGGSTDGTLDVIDRCRESLAKVVSEPDEGIYDALNKGIRLARGDVIGFLHSDDIYSDDKVIEKVANIFMDHGVDSCYGDLVYVDKNDMDKIIRYWKTGNFKPGSFKRGWHPPHPTFFVKKDVYEKYGVFDTRLEVSADFELMLRFLERYRISTWYVPEPIVKMRVGGESNKSLKNILKGNRNCYRAFKMNGLDVSILYPFYRLVPKFYELLKRTVVRAG